MRRKDSYVAKSPCRCAKPQIEKSGVYTTRFGAWEGESVKYRVRRCRTCGGYFETMERPGVPDNFSPHLRKINHI